MQTQAAPHYLIDQNSPLETLLQLASTEDLAALADIITDNGKGRVSLPESTKNTILQHQHNKTLTTIVSLLSSEICAFGGNTVVNTFRQKVPISYNIIAKDVAKKLGANVAKNATIVEIERAILEEVLCKSIKGRKKDEVYSLLNTYRLDVDHEKINRLFRQNKTTDIVTLLFNSCGPYAVSRMINAAALPAFKLAINAGLPALGKMIASRSPAMLNPIATVISAAWMTYDLTGPAYRVTVPAVIRVATIRLAYIKSQTEKFRTELKKCI